MDLNSIQLSPALLTDLYASTLVETEIHTETSPPSLSFIGENRKQVLIVTAHTATALPENEQAFLVNILSACQLSLADVAIINKNDSPLSYNEMIAQLQSRLVLLFGIDPVSFGLPIDFPPFQVQSFDGLNYLYAPPLATLETDKVLKRALWDSLKTLFGIE